MPVFLSHKNTRMGCPMNQAVTPDRLSYFRLRLAEPGPRSLLYNARHSSQHPISSTDRPDNIGIDRNFKTGRTGCSYIRQDKVIARIRRQIAL